MVSIVFVSVISLTSIRHEFYILPSLQAGGISFYVKLHEGELRYFTATLGVDTEFIGRGLIYDARGAEAP